MTRTPIRLVSALLAATVLLAACGDDSDDDATSAPGGTRTVEIDMRDIAFAPDEVQVDAGETVRFVFRNMGAVPHDAFIGDEAAQDDHEMEMRDADAGGMDMDDGGNGDAGEGGITVQPGDTGELTYTFREGDQLFIGCHQQGHYAAGMKIMINMS